MCFYFLADVPMINSDLPDGFYEKIITKNLRIKIDRLANKLDGSTNIEEKNIIYPDSSSLLGQYMNLVLRQALSSVSSKINGLNLNDEKIQDCLEKQNKDLKKKPGTIKILKQIDVCNGIIEGIAEKLNDNDLTQYLIDIPPKQLLSVTTNHGAPSLVKRPESSLTETTLFTGTAVEEPRLEHEFRAEIATSDHIDLLVSFIKWSGIRLLMDDLKGFAESGRSIRILTTTYLGATDAKAIHEIAKLPNSQIKINYDPKHTRLHAKAYIFNRNTHFSTVYIGSSNISRIAMSSGLEWNIKITQYDQPDVLEKCCATFETYWNDRRFILYNPETDRLKLEHSLQDHYILQSSMRKNTINGSDANTEHYNQIFKFDLRPYQFQQEILDILRARRILHNKKKHLVVAATGTGKTMIAAFDYLNFRQELKGDLKQGSDRLLFIAHRTDILRQSLDCFRHVIKDQNFGTLWYADKIPKNSQFDYIFMSIQSFNSKNIIKKFPPEYFDYIIVDEFHHSAAPSYQDLLNYFKPKVLLGLTATPERNDGQSVADKYFEGEYAVELRLYDAINQKLLCPFQYFGVTDSADLRSISWQRGRYSVDELTKLYTTTKDSSYRADLIIDKVREYVTDINEVQGIGFCVSVKHAKFMSNYFSARGIPTTKLDGTSIEEERIQAKQQLKNKDINFIFVADLYNEGVDIPEVNTVLFLRPTESLTVFLQQLGRGLRHADGKECLTVLDFVGHHNKNYNFENKFRALLGKTRRSIKDEVERNFPDVPVGCNIQLERVARERILNNLKSYFVNNRWLENKIKYFAHETNKPLSFTTFINFYNIALEYIYKSKSKGQFLCWNRLCVRAGIQKDFSDKNPDESILTKGIRRLIRCNSPRLLRFMKKFLIIPKDQDFPELGDEESILASMVHYTFHTESPKKLGYKNYLQIFRIIQNNPVLHKEINEVITILLNNLIFIPKTPVVEYPLPLELHCKYILDQILAAFQYYTFDQRPRMSEGVKYLKDINTDLFFITLKKSDKDYSPSTQYKDYSINNYLFHWQSQSQTSPESHTGQRYIECSDTDYYIMLFVRSVKKDEFGTTPYQFLGRARYVRHEGSKPINIVWCLDEKIPAFILRESNKLSVS